MSAPSATARQAPLGLQLENGHSTKITFGRLPAAKFEEIEVTGHPIDGGDGIDMTSMFNNKVRTYAPRALSDTGEFSIKAGYDPAFKVQIRDTLINQNDQITIRHPDGTTDAIWGWLRSWTPDANVEGTRPTATLVIKTSNRDDSGVEREFVQVEVTGT